MGHFTERLESWYVEMLLGSTAAIRDDETCRIEGIVGTLMPFVLHGDGTVLQQKCLLVLLT